MVVQTSAVLVAPVHEGNAAFAQRIVDSLAQPPPIGLSATACWLWIGAGLLGFWAGVIAVALVVF